jgi:hypothetical protein
MKTTEKQSLFWDVRLEDLDEKRHQDFIIQRILEKGDLDDLRWAISFYGSDSVESVFLKNFGKTDSKSQNFWCIYFNINKKECIRNQSMKKQSLFLRR